MSGPIGNPEVVLLRERVNDMAAYLELWNQRSAARDRKAARAAGSMAMERMSTIARQVADMSLRLLAELQAFDDGATGDLPHVQRDDTPRWTDTGSGPGYTEPHDPRG